MVHADRRLRVLFLCTGNSCRSQMAEGWARALAPDTIEPWSAGTAPSALNPLAVRVMAEAGVDISAQQSKHVDSVRGIRFDLVVTVCDDAHEACPCVPGASRVIHRSFDDPPRLASLARTDEEALAPYRRVCDEIRQFILSLHPSLEPNTMSTDDAAPCCPDSCCTPVDAPAVDADAVREQVREGYSRIARVGSACGPSGSGGGCCGGTDHDPAELAAAIGYSAQDLAATPEGANMGLSCGNPTALASLHEGEVVLDLGAGGGFDCFVAGRRVGPTGRVIGVDMTPNMLTKARRNVAHYRSQSGLDNVEFRLGEIEHLPVADGTIDVVISNCVLNLSPDKASVWNEIARVLRPGGRVAVSDLALLRPLPEGVRRDVEALVGCIAGAVLLADTQSMAETAGLSDIALVTNPAYIDAMTDWQDPLYRRIVASLPEGAVPSDYITSLDVSARKPIGQPAGGSNATTGSR